MDKTKVTLSYLAVTRIALHHLIGGLEAGLGDVHHRHLLVVGLLCAEEGRVAIKVKVKRKSHKLKFCQPTFTDIDLRD